MENIEKKFETNQNEQRDYREDLKKIELKEIKRFETIKERLAESARIDNYKGVTFWNPDVDLDIDGWPPTTKEKEIKLAESLGITEKKEVIIPSSWGRGGILRIEGMKEDIVLNGFYIDPEFKKKQLGEGAEEEINALIDREKEKYGKLFLRSAIMDWITMSKMSELGFRTAKPVTILNVDQKESLNPEVISVRKMRNGVRVMDVIEMARLHENEAIDKLVNYSISKLPRELSIETKEQFCKWITEECAQELSKRINLRLTGIEIGVLKKEKQQNELWLDPHNITLAAEIVDLDVTKFSRQEERYDPYIREKEVAQYASMMGNMIYFAKSLEIDTSQVQEIFNKKVLSNAPLFLDEKRSREVVEFLENVEVSIGLKKYFKENGSEFFSYSIECWKDLMKKEREMNKEKDNIFAVLKELYQDIQRIKQEIKKEKITELSGRDEVLNKANSNLLIRKYFSKHISEIIDSGFESLTEEEYVVALEKYREEVNDQLRNNFLF